MPRTLLFCDLDLQFQGNWWPLKGQILAIFYPSALRAVRVLFSPMVFGWVGGWREEVCPACISETVRCRKLILGRDIG